MIGQAAFYAGYTGELPQALRHLNVTGKWQIVDSQGFSDLHRGDALEFTDDKEMITYRKAALITTRRPGRCGWNSTIRMAAPRWRYAG